MQSNPSAPAKSNFARREALDAVGGAFELTTFNTLALESIFLSVKTTPKYYENRIRVLKMTWFQVVKKDKVKSIAKNIHYSFIHN